MCLLVLAWRCHPRYRLVLAGNRDEFHERPTAPLGWWSDTPEILAGRDLRAGGTWLGMARDGRFGLVTNFREANGAPAEAPSRGGLVPSFLQGGRTAAGYLDDLSTSAGRYAGFNLLLGDATGLYYFGNVGGEPPRELPAGTYGLSNHRLDEPWPKLERTRARFVAALSEAEPEAASLLDLLADHEPAEGDPPTDRGLPLDLERALSAPFVKHPRYGTRSSTVVLIDHEGRVRAHERRFDAGGTQSGASRIEFTVAAA